MQQLLHLHRLRKKSDHDGAMTVAAVAVAVMTAVQVALVVTTVVAIVAVEAAVPTVAALVVAVSAAAKKEHDYVIAKAREISQAP